MMQLVGPNVTLLDTMHDKVTGAAEVRERLGVDPAQVVDVMALMGDAIDDIPGVKGIGEKTASRLIAHFGSIDELYARLDRIEETGLRGVQRIRDALTADEEKARQSRFLATIRTDVPLEIRPADLVRGALDRSALRQLADELEFAKLLRDFLEPAPEQPARAIEIVSGEAADALLEASETIALAFAPPAIAAGEAAPELFAPTNDSALAARAGGGGVALAVPGAGPIRYCLTVPAACGGFSSGCAAGRTVVVEDLKAALRAVGLDAGLGPNVGQSGIVDVSLAAYVLDPSRRAYTIDALASDRLGRSLPIARAERRWSAPRPSRPRSSRSARRSPTSSRQSARCPLPRLELPLARVLAIVEARGLAVDRGALERAGRDFRVAADALEKEIHALAGGPFNIQSPNQLREVLFDKLGLPTKGIKRGKTGLSVDADVLARLAESHPIAAKVCEHRVLLKLISTYVTSLADLVDARTGRLHTSINQTVAATGRLSSSDPNLQNIPVRSAEGRRIREAFVAPPGRLLLAADYSQIELRVLAHLTGDPVLLAAFRNGEDIHRRTAAEVFGVDPEAVTRTCGDKPR
jgi:DNA polymerase-1